MLSGPEVAEIGAGDGKEAEASSAKGYERGGDGGKCLG